MDAERFASGREVAQAVGDIVNVTAGTMRLRDWYEECLTEEYLAPSTAAKWAGGWRLHVEPALGSHALARIPATTFNGWSRRRGSGRRGRQGKHSNSHAGS